MVAVRLLSLLVCCVLVLLAREASAQEPSDQELTLTQARRALVAGDPARAHELLDGLPDGAPASIVDDLRTIADRWGGQPTSRGAEASTPWEASFLAARERLARRAYHEATHRFAALRADAPDRESEARARVMHLLAFEAAAAVDAETARDKAHADAAKRKEEKAREQAAARAKEDPARTVPRWYGWQTLLADAAALGVFPLDTSSPACPGCLMYFAGGPIVHAFHARPKEAVISLGTRLAAPLMIGAMGCFGAMPLTAMGGGGSCPDAIVYAGAGMGVVTAIVVDAAVFARERVPIEDRARPVGLTPAFAPRREGGVDVGLSGTF